MVRWDSGLAIGSLIAAVLLLVVAGMQIFGGPYDTTKEQDVQRFSPEPNVTCYAVRASEVQGVHGKGVVAGCVRNMSNKNTTPTQRPVEPTNEETTEDRG